jgi:sirohydrochlorin ferrochelatase
MKLPICLLVDNGSLRPEAIFSLRRVAQKLSIETEFEVLPVGLLHSNKIKPSDLDDIKTETVGTFLTSPRGKKEKSLLILPLFLGPSRGITEWLVSRLEEWRREEVGRSYQVLDCLHIDGDHRLAQALVGEINNLIDREHLSTPRVAMVDHGTPIAEVNRVREQVGADLRKIQNYTESEFSTCSMERREGDQYSFNEPLLEGLLLKWGQEGSREVVVALFFLLSGRHAGEGGDLAKICENASSLFPQMKIYQTNPLAEHDIVFSILKEKLEIFNSR